METKRAPVRITEEAWLAAKIEAAKNRVGLEKMLGDVLEKYIRIEIMEEEKKVDQKMMELALGKLKEKMSAQHFINDSDGAGNDIDEITNELITEVTATDERMEIYEYLKRILGENYKKVAGVNSSGEFECYYYNTTNEWELEFDSLEEFYRYFRFPEADEV